MYKCLFHLIKVSNMTSSIPSEWKSPLKYLHICSLTVLSQTLSTLHTGVFERMLSLNFQGFYYLFLMFIFFTLVCFLYASIQLLNSTPRCSFFSALHTSGLGLSESQEQFDLQGSGLQKGSCSRLVSVT